MGRMQREGAAAPHSEHCFHSFLLPCIKSAIFYCVFSHRGNKIPQSSCFWHHWWENDDLFTSPPENVCHTQSVMQSKERPRPVSRGHYMYRGSETGCWGGWRLNRRDMGLQPQPICGINAFIKKCTPGWVADRRCPGFTLHPFINSPGLYSLIFCCSCLILCLEQPLVQQVSLGLTLPLSSNSVYAPRSHSLGWFLSLCVYQVLSYLLKTCVRKISNQSSAI